MTSMGRYALSTLGIAALCVGTASGAQAATTFTTTLLGSNEVPPVVTSGFGTGQLILADDMNSFDVLIEFSDLTANAVAGHVHCCSSADMNSAVAIGFTVPNATSGTISGSYDLTLASTYNPSFFTASGGTVEGARSAFLTGLDGGLAYFNVHSAQFPSGEIRGQLSAIPEPATWGMLLLGFGAIGAGIRRTRTRMSVSFG